MVSQDWDKKFKAIWKKNLYLSMAFVLFLKENADYFNGKVDYLPYALMVSIDQTKEKDYWHFYTPIVESPVKFTEDMHVNLLGGWGWYERA